MLLEFLAELAHRNQILTLLALGVPDVGRGVAEEIGHLHAGNRHRPLECHEHARPGPLVGRHREDIPVAQFDRAAGHLVARMAHDGKAERALARPVGPHQGMGLALPNDKIDAAEDLLAFHGHVTGR